MTSETRIWKDLLAILSEEELLRFIRRLQRAGNLTLANILSSELHKRGT